MSYVKLNLAVTIDGYISRLDDSVDFLTSMGDELTKTFNEFLETVDVIIMGSKTYEVMLGFGDYPFKEKTTYVMTKRKFEDNNYITFTSDNIEDILAKHKNNVWLFGGATLIKEFIEKDLVDEYIISIAPVLIGEGIPLFKKSSKQVELDLVSVTEANGMAILTYKKRVS
jgi:dihydrofolate reductase